ncbi:MarR family transcriptional regulator [Microbacterium hatanonis]|jgi:DNA-binding MarR family transcriptional regulator|uniref:MarR family transcriptional regulator n=2 Tax=Microbacterium hatanonis TaxID=404366 RepID=A0A5C8I507_9MICO|nr:MarR family transcriptional regulator [Microbacterium hatanonis]
MNERESRAWRGLIAVTQLLPAALDARLQRDAQLTHFEFGVLTILHTMRGPAMRMTELAEATNATLPRLSNVCSRLEKRGLIERSPCADDRRATNVGLTTAGRRALIHSIPDHIATVRSVVVDALSEEQLDALADITDTIIERLASLDDAAPPPAASRTAR